MNRNVAIGGSIVAIVGLVLFVVGLSIIGITETEEQCTTVWFVTTCTDVTTYPYAVVGVGMMIGGIIMAIVGVIVIIVGAVMKPPIQVPPIQYQPQYPPQYPPPP